MLLHGSLFIPLDSQEFELLATYVVIEELCTNNDDDIRNENVSHIITLLSSHHLFHDLSLSLS